MSLFEFMSAGTKVIMALSFGWEYTSTCAVGCFRSEIEELYVIAMPVKVIREEEVILLQLLNILTTFLRTNYFR